MNDRELNALLNEVLGESTSPKGCPAPDALWDFVEAPDHTRHTEAIRLHLASCSACATQVVRLNRGLRHVRRRQRSMHQRIVHLLAPPPTPSAVRFPAGRAAFAMAAAFALVLPLLRFAFAPRPKTGMTIAAKPASPIAGSAAGKRRLADLGKGGRQDRNPGQRSLNFDSARTPRNANGARNEIERRDMPEPFALSALVRNVLDPSQQPAKTFVPASLHRREGRHRRRDSFGMLVAQAERLDAALNRMDADPPFTSTYSAVTSGGGRQWNLSRLHVDAVPVDYAQASGPTMTAFDKPLLRLHFPTRSHFPVRGFSMLAVASDTSWRRIGEAKEKRGVLSPPVSAAASPATMVPPPILEASAPTATVTAPNWQWSASVRVMSMPQPATPTMLASGPNDSALVSTVIPSSGLPDAGTQPQSVIQTPVVRPVNMPGLLIHLKPASLAKSASEEALALRTSANLAIVDSGDPYNPSPPSSPDNTRSGGNLAAALPTVDSVPASEGPVPNEINRPMPVAFTHMASLNTAAEKAVSGEAISSSRMLHCDRVTQRFQSYLSVRALTPRATFRRFSTRALRPMIPPASAVSSSNVP